MTDWFSPIYAIFVLCWLMALGATACTQVYQYGNNDTVTVTNMINGNSATIPLSGLPGIP